VPNLAPQHLCFWSPQWIYHGTNRQHDACVRDPHIAVAQLLEVTWAPCGSAGPGGGRCPGSTCSRRPWNTVPSSAACASTASDGSANCASAMPLDRLVALRQ
jgi:hypothetical protein